MQRPTGRRPRRRQEGFTLIELGVVLAIIAILAAIAVPTYTGMVQRAREAEAAQAWGMVKSEVWTYYLQNNAFPENAADNNDKDTGWPDPNVIDKPTSTDNYWAYTASSNNTADPKTFSFTATHGTTTLTWTIDSTGKVTSP